MKLLVLHESPWYKTHEKKSPQRREFDAVAQDADIQKRRNTPHQLSYASEFKKIIPLIGKRFRVVNLKDPHNKFIDYGETGIVADAKIENLNSSSGYTLNFDGDANAQGKPYGRRGASTKKFFKFLEIVDDTHPLDTTPSAKSLQNQKIRADQAAQAKASAARTKAAERQVDAGKFDDEYYLRRQATGH